MAVFSKLTKAQRDKLPASEFGDPANRLFPIIDQDDVDSAAHLIGKAKNPAAVKRRIIAIAKRKGLKIPDAWKSADNSANTESVTLTADFAIESEEEDGDDVVLSGRFFRSGSYPDKQFELTPDEMYQSIAAFLDPVPIDLEHRPMLFNDIDLTGAVGTIDAVWSDDGEWMMARARKPKWLHQVMPETRISASFSRQTKEVIGAAWTATPRVAGAELVAAFARARHDTTSGQMAMQHIHDAAVRGGAVCAAPDGTGSGKAQMASRHEAKAIQQVHDVAVEHGAACESGGRSPGAMAGYFNVSGSATRQPASQTRRRVSMAGLLDWIKGKAAEDGIEVDERELQAAFSAKDGPSRADIEAADKKHQEALEALRQQHAADLENIRKQQEATAATFAAQARERRELEAAQFAERQVAAKKVPPAAREALAALAARVGHSDAAATFSEGEKSTRALLDEFLSKLPDFSVFTTAGIDLKDVAALFNEGGTDGKGEGLSEERRKHLLGATPLGRSIERDKSASN